MKKKHQFVLVLGIINVILPVIPILAHRGLFGMSAYIGFCCSYSGLTDFIDTIPRLLYTKPTSKSQTNNSYDYETFVIVIILTTFLSADPKPDIWLRV
jgi:hypothetical protein